MAVIQRSTAPATARPNFASMEAVASLSTGSRATRASADP
jgi:hypothetical protein